MERDLAAAGCTRAVDVNNLVDEGAGIGKVGAQQGLVAADKVRHVENTWAANKREEARPWWELQRNQVQVRAQIATQPHESRPLCLRAQARWRLARGNWSKIVVGHYWRWNGRTNQCRPFAVAACALHASHQVQLWEPSHSSRDQEMKPPASSFARRVRQTWASRP